MRSAIALSMLAGLLGTPAWADGDAGRRSETWMAVGDATLDRLRGGFDAGGGLMVTFGISRAVYINGGLVTQTTLNFGQLNNLNAAQAEQLSKQMAALNLVQNGPGNTFAPQQAGTSGTVIQNTLDNQHIMNRTVIDASSNSLGMIKNQNMQSTINDAVARAIGGPR
ncbi:hypothetical protein [Variovorax saccharolyticus]|uniref:hypothetical protein n=1 Tax=Variovorax saccharolyticus TaxID=3053516 RepID=UPI002576943C|nr:hypothetical protein [Variovorax sp. J31P216]MDM0023358.1 hypothetical protein [Variovorax sp. J31P216]